MKAVRLCTAQVDIAREEFPELDLTILWVQSAWAAVLQDPLAELVKIDPKGQSAFGLYQHDVNQKKTF